ncbi:helix-turn-helix domain-containing protein [Companilactobacillus sp. HBUAS59544]|uniref:helix-turn-helix domain-containing protein n=1 Tax=Companilactobacillus sp. HBUAS59544 TaxID=3109363 RepID=UPI002FF1A0FD
MVKFNLDFKIKIVTEYLSRCGSTSLAKRYGVANEYMILNWVHNFELRGMDLNYSSHFKVQVLNWKNQNKASPPATALHFNLSSPSTIWQWQKKYDDMGIAGLERRRGNPKVNKRKSPKKISFNNINEEIKRLKQENTMLKIQNEYLKKVDALVQKKSAQKKSQK